MEEYAQAGGCPEKELVWRREYINRELEKVRTYELEALRNLTTADAFEAIPGLLELREFEDDYFRFWYAFTLLEIAPSNHLDGQLKAKVFEVVRVICAELSNGPINICAKNRAQVTSRMLSALNASTPEEYVQNYAQRLKNRA